MSGIVDILGKVASGAQSVKTIHDVSKGFVNQYSGLPDTSYNSLTMHCPASAVVNEPVVVSGTSPPGLVELYSQSQLERSVYPENGEWFTRIFFSVPGLYKLYARHQGDVVSCEVTVTE